MWLKKLAYHALCLISIVISVERGAQQHHASHQFRSPERDPDTRGPAVAPTDQVHRTEFKPLNKTRRIFGPVSYTHIRAHETRHDLVCRLLLEKKKKKNK